MKRLFTYGLVLLLMVAFNYKTISYYFSMNDNSICCFQDLDCEEESNESEKSDEKDKKTDLFDSFFIPESHQLLVNNQPSFIQPSLLYFTSDYSLGVYSPPEQAVI